MTIDARIPVYQLNDIVCGYEGKPVLRVESLSLYDDGPVAFVGHNGSGKSTLLNLLAFLLPPISGELLFQGATAGESGRGSLDATMLLQDPYLLRRSVFENVAYGLKARGMKDVRSRVVEALEMVGLSPDFARREWYQLSGGEARRVALASRLALRTKVLLLDEPTANVDEESAQLIAQVILDARRMWGALPLIATHDLQWLDSVTQRRIFMRRGRIERQPA